MDNVLWILAAVALVVYLVVRRLLGEPLQSRRLTILPLGLAIFGGYQLSKLHHVHATDIAVLAAEAGIAVALGLLRGLTIQVYVQDGLLWQRYRPVTIAVWLGSIAVRFGVSALGWAAGADRQVLQTALLLMLGLTLLGEAAVVGFRALRLGAPFAAAPTRTLRRARRG